MTYQPITIQLDAHLIRHPEALHLRRMRIGLWLYLELLSRLESGDIVEFFPEITAQQMGLKVGTVRSWLGHLRQAGYIRVRRADGRMLVTVRGAQAAEPVKPPAPTRFFTVRKLQDALGEDGNSESFEAALTVSSDRVIQRALAATLAVPGEQIRKSRTALFLYFTKRYSHETNQDQENPLH